MVKPDQILSFANGLVSSGSVSEVQARQAAARAYYSVMLLVRDELNVDTSDVTQGSHQLVRQALYDEVRRTSSPRRYQQLALNLWFTMASARIDADYHLKDEFKVSRGKETVELAKTIFNIYPN